MSKSYPQLMDETIHDTINDEGSFLMKIQGVESDEVYDTPTALEALKQGDFYNSLSSMNKDLFNEKIQDAIKEVQKNEEKNKKNKKKKEEPQRKRQDVKQKRTRA